MTPTKLGQLRDRLADCEIGDYAGRWIAIGSEDAPVGTIINLHIRPRWRTGSVFSEEECATFIRRNITVEGKTMLAWQRIPYQPEVEQT